MQSADATAAEPKNANETHPRYLAMKASSSFRTKIQTSRGCVEHRRCQRFQTITTRCVIALYPRNEPTFLIARRWTPQSQCVLKRLGGANSHLTRGVDTQLV